MRRRRKRRRRGGRRKVEREREKRGVIATRVQDREELRRDRERKERRRECVWRTLANINSLCKSAAQTN